MPTPAVLSAQMDPPPIVPVVEMDYVNGEYKLNGGDTTFDALMYNASGPFEDIGLVAGEGITGLHWDTTNSFGGPDDPYPPSIRGTQLMCDTLVAAMTGSGGLTAVCEFDVDAPEIWGANDSVPIFWFQRDSLWGDGAKEGDVYWQTYMETGVQGEGYFDDEYGVGSSYIYQGGSAWEASNDRRYRMSGTWCFDLGPEAGVNRYQGGQSIDGQPQGIDTSFGETPSSVDRNLSFMDKLTAAHFFGIGVDTADIAATGEDNGWWWWPKGGWIIRYLAFYRVRPISVLASLSRVPHTPIRVGQLYAEVIHGRPTTPGLFKHIPAAVRVQPVLPKVGIVAHPALNISATANAPTTIGN